MIYESFNKDSSFYIMFTHVQKIWIEIKVIEMDVDVQEFLLIVCTRNTPRSDYENIGLVRDLQYI